MGIESGEGRRRAIVICNGKFDDPKLPQLAGVAADHEAVTRVLQGPAAGFEVTSLLDEGLVAARLAVATVC
jgi:hypothetical protein